MSSTKSNESIAKSSRIAGPRPVSSDRRLRRHLRELCDEVLASYRVAADKDLWTEADRLEARAVLAKVLPFAAGH